MTTDREIAPLRGVDRGPSGESIVTFNGPRNDTITCVSLRGGRFLPDGLCPIGVGSLPAREKITPKRACSEVHVIRLH